MNTRMLRYALIPVLFVAAGVYAHDYFFSNTEAWVSGNRLWGVMSVNREDLFNACMDGRPMTETENMPPAQRGAAIAAYMSQQISLVTADNRIVPVTVDSVGKASATIARVWFHLDAPAPLKSFDIINRTLFSTLPKQQNFMTIQFPCEKKSIILSSSQFRRSLLNPCR